MMRINKLISKIIRCRLVFKLLGLLVIGLFTANNAYALACKNATDGNAYLTDNLTSASVPKSAPNGTVIWRSENRTMTVKCWKDQAGNGGLEAEAENVYTYLNPYASFQRGYGISIGIVANGQTIDMNNYRMIIPNVIVPYCNQGADWCRDNASVTFTWNYYVYISKVGDLFGDYYGADNYLPVFQIDGAGGLNTNPNSNFIYNISGMRNVRFINCNTTVSVTPSDINFGTIVVPENVQVGQLAKSSNFKATVTKDCSSPFKLTAIYSSPADKFGADTLDMRNGLGIKIKNIMTDSYIQYGDINSFADLSVNNSIDIPFAAELSWIKSVAALGVFNSSLTITVYYN
ncbi:MAG: fimbrial protein [Serratia sp. (in: enterobacteria)]|uniref:fimbrial protein n=1 Tax=Serratia sp. (in: enterobacteria) TaxID=616 RepID=UPI003F2CC070